MGNIIFPEIHILFKFHDTPWGGANQFLKALREYFREKKCYSESPDEADVILFNSYPFGSEEFFGLLRKIKKKKNPVVIHRVDGPTFLIRNKDIEIDRIIFDFNQKVADGTIFQAHWSKRESYLLGMKQNDFETVIINTCDATIFYPKKKQNKTEKIKLIASSWSPNPRKGFEIYEFLDENLDFDRYEMTFVGNSPVTFKRINHIPPQPSNILADILRDHTIYITASINDTCSNSLIEALHCGLPAVVRNSGGHSEIIGEGGMIFNGKDDVLNAIEQVSDNLDRYRNAIRVPDIHVVGDSYYSFCEKVYSMYQQGKYKPKNFNTFKYLSILLKSYFWKKKG